MKGIRVLLVDDQRLFVESLRTLINTYSDDIDVVDIAFNGFEAIEAVDRTKPDIILMDIYMPKMNGVEAGKQILKKYPEIKIMMLATYGKDELVVEALREGASGYLLKDISPTELIACIRALNEGAVQISPSVASSLVGQIFEVDRVEFEMKKSFEWYTTLSKKEKEIFALIATGYDNTQIAEKMYIAEQTVRNYVSNIYSKLGIKDRFQIIQLANQIKSNNTVSE